MTANDVIEAYVTEVATRLPRGRRNDVAFELRALIEEGLQARAEEAGRPADADMATDFLRSFGLPADVAARYLPTLTIIDPADGHRFLRASAIGLAILWSLGLVAHLRQPVDSVTELLGVLGQWWVSTLNLSLGWLGLLVLVFGAGAWARRRQPGTAVWKPRPADRLRGGRAAQVLAIAGILCGLFVLLDPRWVLDVFFGGRAAPAAYEALTYTETFRGRQAPWLLVLLLLNIPMLIAAVVNGRKSAIMRRVEVELGLVTCAVMAWTVLDGPVFLAPASDQTCKACLVLIIVFTLVWIGISLHRSVRPAPAERVQLRR